MKKARDHQVRKLANGRYEISWRFDNPRSTALYPQVCKRSVDYACAARFAKRWGLQEPER